LLRHGYSSLKFNRLEQLMSFFTTSLVADPLGDTKGY